MADRVILHCDLNCFFASVELLRYPALRDVPVAVCGDPESRHGIVLAKNEAAKQLAVPYDLAKYVHDNGRLPVVNFAAGGVATPADAALMMELGAEGVFVGSGIFKSGDPAKRAAAIVQATANWQDADLLARLSENLGEAMVGINEDEIQTIMAARGE